jgi:hypothetical protein
MRISPVAKKLGLKPGMKALLPGAPSEAHRAGNYRGLPFFQTSADQETTG